MKKTGKILALSILGLFVVSTLMASFASAALTDTFNSFFGGNSMFASQADMVTKVLLIILVVLLVYSVVSFLPFMPKGNKWLPWVLSVVVGVLSFMFVSAENIKYILGNYEALGIMLVTILPLIIIITFTVQLRKSDFGSAGIINKILIIGYLAYTGIRWGTLSLNVPAGQAMPEMFWLYPITMIGLLVWLFIERRVALALYKEEIKAQVVEGTKDAMAALTAEITYDKKRLAGLSGAAADTLQRVIDRNQAALDKMKF